MSGKGSSPRPYSVPKKVYEENWDRIFGKKSKDKKDDKDKQREKQK